MKHRGMYLLGAAVVWAASLWFAWNAGRSGQATVAGGSVDTKPDRLAVGLSTAPDRGSSGTSASGVSTDRIASFVEAQSSGKSEPWTSSCELAVEVSPRKAREIFAERDPILRAQQFLDLLAVAGPADMPMLLESLRESGGDGADREFQWLVYRWGQLDGPAAIAFATAESREGGGRGRDRGYWQTSSVLSGWATSDPDAAVAWAKENARSEENYYMIGVINGISKSDLSGATELAQELPYGRVRGQVADILIDGYFVQGADEAMRWAGSLPDGRLKEGIMSRVAGRVAREDPYTSANWVMSSASEEGRADAVSEIVGQWVRRDPEQATQWLAGVSDPEAKKAGIEQVARSWAWRDPAAAGEWLSQFPRGPELDGAVKNYVESVSRRDPETALNWATAITDDEIRRPLLEDIMRDWQRRDPDRAKDFLDRIQ